ncbi:GerAB/ArcD/ProY family transporter [Oceanirhabdus sp. W0125-5]|uniref:GerAB/ArcD/ProY family transporter n=1 Tax=Oceanirhabdus sp. W0125-5 TaxID=2999116 RepID=UPI0022F2B62A|nr:GerAB/ArcD/ProY family transporter [Oceanirhabdus sp. W0125-5]WBW98349.1 GerAB/ArcD/ProY family transporter [Oceanirhabdus sp. W0125-5]
MNTEKNNLLTPNQLTYVLLGFVVGTGFLKLPNQLVETAGQDSWICVILALIYPLYMIFVGIYIRNKHPNVNILFINERYFGKLFGSLINIVFMMQFIISAAAVIAYTMVFCRVYIASFFAPFKIALIIVVLAAYASSKGVVVLAKLNQIIFYFFIPTFLLSLIALKYGSIINLEPVFGVGMSKVIKAIPDTATSYYGWECLFLIIPYTKEIKSIKKAALKAVAICVVIYVWVVFITIYYLSIDITPKSYWSFILVFESINIPIINNFRYIFMFIWVLLSFKSTANYYFALTIFVDYFKKIELKRACFLIFPFILLLAYIFSDGMLRDKIVGFTDPASIIFNVVFLTIVSLMIYFKGKNSYNSN